MSKKIVYGPVYPVLKTVEIPSERAGEKRIITQSDLQKDLEEFLELQTNPHICKIYNNGNIKRTLKDGKEVLFEKEKEDGRDDR